MIKVLVSQQVPKEGLKSLEDRFELDFYKTMEDALQLPEIGEYQAIISLFNEKMPEEIIEKADKLKIISNYGVGFNNIPVSKASSKGIMVTNTPESVKEPTAELAMALMLAVARRLPELDARLRSDEFPWGLMDNLGFGLYGKTLGIVGFGRIGQAMARRGQAMGMETVYYSRNRVGEDIEVKYKARHVALEELLRNSDYVSLHVPYTDQTHHLMGKEQFALMKKDAFLVNTARGSVIDEAALIDALEAGIIRGAGLDVYENEPKIPERMRQLPNVVMSPHIGTACLLGRIKTAEEAARSLQEFFKGEVPINIVNRESL